MSIKVEAILEAANIISQFPQDLSVLREQKRIFNKYVNGLIDYAAQQSVQRIGCICGKKTVKGKTVRVDDHYCPTHHPANR